MLPEEASDTGGRRTTTHPVSLGGRRHCGPGISPWPTVL